MKVLVSAYACAPGRGSEPGAGWAWARAAAATVDDVVLLTRRKNVELIRRECHAEGITNVMVVGHDLGRLAYRLKKILPFGTQLYYLVWQFTSTNAVKRRISVDDVDLVHHLTFAVDWLPTGMSQLGRPLVWGPVGGAVRLSIRELPLVPWQSRTGEIIRAFVTASGRMIWGRPTARRARVVIVQNRDELVALRSPDAVIAPNVVAEPSAPDHCAPKPDGPVRLAVVVGRLIGLKGVHHIIDAFALPETEGWRLEVAGDGPLMTSLIRRTQRRGIAHKVTFHGQLSRAQVDELLQRADALVSASLHEAAGFAVAEAVASGCPVIYAARGGPVEVVPPDAGIPISIDRNMPKKIACALGHVGPRMRPNARWSASRLPDTLSGVYKAALESTRDHRP